MRPSQDSSRRQRFTRMPSILSSQSTPQPHPSPPNEATCVSATDANATANFNAKLLMRTYNPITGAKNPAKNLIPQKPLIFWPNPKTFHQISAQLNLLIAILPLLSRTRHFAARDDKDIQIMGRKSASMARGQFAGVRLKRLATNCKHLANKGRRPSGRRPRCFLLSGTYLANL